MEPTGRETRQGTSACAKKIGSFQMRSLSEGTRCFVLAASAVLFTPPRCFRRLEQCATYAYTITLRARKKERNWLEEGSLWRKNGSPLFLRSALWTLMCLRRPVRRVGRSVGGVPFGCSFQRRWRIKYETAWPAQCGHRAVRFFNAGWTLKWPIVFRRSMGQGSSVIKNC